MPYRPPLPFGGAPFHSPGAGHALVRANCAHAVFAAAQRKLCIAALPFLPKSNPLRWASILIIKILFAGNPFFGCMRVRAQASARSAERPFCRYSPQDFVGKRDAPFTVDSFSLSPVKGAIILRLLFLFDQADARIICRPCAVRFICACGRRRRSPYLRLRR